MQIHHSKTQQGVEVGFPRLSRAGFFKLLVCKGIGASLIKEGLLPKKEGGKRKKKR